MHPFLALLLIIAAVIIVACWVANRADEIERAKHRHPAGKSRYGSQR